jgi:hypothetical protein
VLLRKHQRASLLATLNGYAIRTVCSVRSGTAFVVMGRARRGDAEGRSRSSAAGIAANNREGRLTLQSKYPNVCVALLGEDENAFAIVERVQRAMREAGVPTAEVKAFTVEACSGDYYHLLETVLRTVETT